MNETVVVALLSLAGTAIGSIAGIMTANKMVNYRISQLEKKVDKHNEVIQRTFLLEQRVEDDEKELGKIEGRIERLEHAE